jgi:IS5 family transposase
VTIDTTVPPKAVTHPTDSKLIQRGVENLVRLACRHGVGPRQSYARVSARRAARPRGRAHPWCGAPG